MQSPRIQKIEEEKKNKESLNIKDILRNDYRNFKPGLCCILWKKMKKKLFIFLLKHYGLPAIYKEIFTQSLERKFVGEKRGDKNRSSALWIKSSQM